MWETFKLQTKINERSNMHIEENFLEIGYGLRIIFRKVDSKECFHCFRITRRITKRKYSTKTCFGKQCLIFRVRNKCLKLKLKLKLYNFSKIVESQKKKN